MDPIKKSTVGSPRRFWEIFIDSEINCAHTRVLLIGAPVNPLTNGVFLLFLLFFRQILGRLLWYGYLQGGVCSVRYVPRHTAGITGTGHFGKFGTTSIPVPRIPVPTEHPWIFGS